MATAALLADILGWLGFIAALFIGMLVVIVVSIVLVATFWRHPVSDWEAQEHERAEIFSKHLDT